MAYNKVNSSNNILDDYAKWLRENMSAYTFNSGVVELTVPFLDSSNDYIQIYLIKNIDNSYILTDDGETLFNLSTKGVPINSAKRRDILNTICNNYGVELSNNALTINTDSKTLPQAKHRLIQAIQAVSDMSVLSQKSVTSMFIDDVTDFLIDNKILYTRTIEIAGKSGYSHHVDFSIPKQDAPNVFLNVKNKLNKDAAQLEIFSVSEMKQTRKDPFVPVVLIDDTNRIANESAINALRQYDIQPLNWSDKTSILSLLTS